MTQWERRADETDKSFAAFCAYRDLPTQVRSIKRAYESHTGKKCATRQPPRNWLEWSRTKSWQDRVRAYDAYLENQNRELREQHHGKKLREHLDQQERLASECVEASIKLLEHANKRMKELSDQHAEKSKAAKKGGTQPPTMPMPTDVTQSVKAAVSAGDAASAARSEALGVDMLLQRLESDDQA